jgi:2-polyprenyl-6-methoxyphenol hydroxylase-like FAD-dependent oxidoreductase
MDFETFALVVGGGPVGLSAAIDLRWRNVPTILVTANLETATHPKCNTTNARSMEHFRRLGLVDAIRAEQLPLTVERASAYVTRFCGHEFARLQRPSHAWPAPEQPANISQIRLEKVFRRHTEKQDAPNTHFG